MNQTIEQIKLEKIGLEGDLIIPEGSNKLIVFAHGSGSSRFSPRNKFVASYLNSIGVATLLIDLLTPEEEMVDDIDYKFRFNISLLSYRLLLVCEYLESRLVFDQISLGIFGASTGAAAALVVAAAIPQNVKALALRGGRPDLVPDYLSEVVAPTLMIVGENDKSVLDLNKAALKRMINSEDKSLVVVKNAGHLFEEKGALNQVAFEAGKWFEKHLVQNK